MYSAIVFLNVDDRANSPPRSVLMDLGSSFFSPYRDRNNLMVLIGGSFVFDKNIHTNRVAASTMSR